MHKHFELDKEDLDILRDLFYNVLDIETTDDQISKLLTLCPDWDGITDTVGREEVADTVCLHFLGMEVPMYGSPEKYKKDFKAKLKEKKEDIIKFIK